MCKKEIFLKIFSPFIYLYKTFYQNPENFKLLYGTTIMLITVIKIGVDHLCLTFIICMLCLGAISTAISSKVYLHLQKKHPAHFQEDIRTELPAILAYYQCVHKFKKCSEPEERKNLKVQLMEELERKNKIPSPLVRHSWRKTAIICKTLKKTQYKSHDYKAITADSAPTITGNLLGATKFLVSQSVSTMNLARELCPDDGKKDRRPTMTSLASSK